MEAVALLFATFGDDSLEDDADDPGHSEVLDARMVDPRVDRVDPANALLVHLHKSTRDSVLDGRVILGKVDVELLGEKLDAELRVAEVLAVQCDPWYLALRSELVAGLDLRPS